MRYVGGKGRIAAGIADAVRARTDARIVYEPFIGGGGITPALLTRFERVIAADSHLDMVLMWRAVAEGWVPPDVVTEEEYARARHEPPSALRGFIGSGGSFGGKWFAGYARGGRNTSGEPRNHQGESARSIMRVAPLMRGMTVEHRDYRETPLVDGTAIYCDPPYAATLGYRDEFDTEAFWAWAEEAASVADVFVSEYAAPEGWVPVWEAQKRQSVTRPDQGREHRTERLFIRP